MTTTVYRAHVNVTPRADDPSGLAETCDRVIAVIRDVTDVEMPYGAELQELTTSVGDIVQTVRVTWQGPRDRRTAEAAYRRAAEALRNAGYEVLVSGWSRAEREES